MRVAADGARVVFLRSTGPDDAVQRLWAYDVASATERLVADAEDGRGIRGYAVDPAARVAVFALDGRLHRADLVTGELSPVPTTGPARDPRPDPTGRRIGYLDGPTLRVIEPDGTDVLLAGEPEPAAGGAPQVTWGRAEPVAARHFGRHRGYWWAPDGAGVLAARVDLAVLPRTRGRAEVTLHLLDLDGGWVDVHWDRETYPYLVSVDWSDHGDPLITVLRRPQQHGLVLAVDPRTGETQVHAELADPRWVEPIPGTPCHLTDGRVLVGGELAHDGYDARCLFADGTLLTPPTLYVRRLVGRPPGMPAILVEASEGEPSEQHVFRVGTSVGSAGIDARRVTTTPGWHRAAVGGDTVVIGTDSLDHPGAQWAVWRGDAQVGTLTSYAATTGTAPRPTLERVTDRRLPAGVLYPAGHLGGRRLPVLVDAYGLEQGVRSARAAWLERRWWADAGFAVVVVDPRGTPGVAPSYEKVVHRRLADLLLADTADALAALAGKHPDLDLARVAVRGHGVGGWLAALAALARPEMVRCAVARAPIVDWAHYDAAFAERYLGLADDGTDVYAHHSLLTLAAEPVRDAEVRPVLLVADEPEPRDDLARLGAALEAAGRPYHLLTTGDAASRRDAELDFLRRHTA